MSSYFCSTFLDYGFINYQVCLFLKKKSAASTANYIGISGMLMQKHNQMPCPSIHQSIKEVLSKTALNKGFHINSHSSNPQILPRKWLKIII